MLLKTVLVAQSVKNLPIVQETQVRSLGWEDPLRKKMASHSSKLAWKKSHGQRSLVVYSQWGRKELDTTEQLNVHHPTLMWQELRSVTRDLQTEPEPDRWGESRGQCLTSGQSCGQVIDI